MRIPRRSRFVSLGLVALCLLGTAAAESLWVTTEGSNSVSYADNDIVHPWLTPSKAWSEALAGDTVYFRGAIYTITVTIDTKALGSAQGTEIQPVAFTGYNDSSSRSLNRLAWVGEQSFGSQPRRSCLVAAFSEDELPDPGA